SLSYVDVQGASRELGIGAGSLAFTFCQTPIVVTSGASADRISVHYEDGRTEVVDSLTCPAAVSRSVFEKSGEVERIDVSFA
ncbi:MAG TPA: hypothetical protein VKA06_05570, partial [Spirochaetia bacterium]|nr:hypothetical protein [Spirochaetia bacterium]